MGAFGSKILPFLSTFAMVATMPSVVLAGSGRNTLDGGATGTIFCRDIGDDESETFASWRITADDPSKPIRFVNTALTTDNGITERYLFFIDSTNGAPFVSRNVIFNNDPESVNLTGFVSGIGYRYIIRAARPITATCD
jgi:hypothetical protein